MTALKRLPLPFVGESSNSKLHPLLQFSTTKVVLKVTLIDGFNPYRFQVILLQSSDTPQVA
jgi:hypothetical protein